MVGIIGYMSGGKSYFAVEQILKYLSSGHRVSTNIRLKCQAVTSYTGLPCIFWKQLYYYLCEEPSHYHELKIDDYNSFPHGAPRGSPYYEQNMCYCFLDEASSIFDSMVHASDSNINKVATWARHTEKRGIKVYLLMQFESELHKRLRVHITEYIKCLNTSTFKVPLLGTGVPSFLKNISLRRVFLADAETPVGPLKAYKFESRVYNCYDTAQIVVGTNDITPFKPVYLNTAVQELRKGILVFSYAAVLWFACNIYVVVWLVRHA